MISMLLYLFAFLSFAWAQCYVKYQSIESQGNLDFLTKKNAENIVRKNLRLLIEDQKNSPSRFGLSCEDGWDLLCSGETLDDCSCLRFYYGECVRYSTAELVCSGSGGNLPIVNSELKNKFLYVYPDQTKYGAWIGLKNNGSGFYWADGTELKDQNWNPPKNTSTGDGNCVHYVGDEEFTYVAVDFAWKDSPCNENRPLVCEMKPRSIRTTVTDSQTEITTTYSQPEPTTTKQPGACPHDYIEKCFGSSCYCYGVKRNTPMYWGNAVAVCRSEGADMVSIHSEAENEYIKDILGINAWIGCLYSSDTWVDGTKMNDYSNWRDTQYDADTVGYINLAAYNGQWMTVSTLSYQLPFVCKKPRE